MTPNPNIEGKTTQKPTEIDNATGKVFKVTFPTIPGKVVSEVKLVTKKVGEKIDISGQLAYSTIIDSYVDLETGEITMVLARYTNG